MAKPKIHDLPDLSHLAHAGTKVVVRAKLGAALNRLVYENGEINIAVIATSEQGRAKAAIRAVLASAMPIAAGDLILQRGRNAGAKTSSYDRV